ncbi:MAG: ribonuclease III [Thermomicrobiales bacterium]
MTANDLDTTPSPIATEAAPSAWGDLSDDERLERAEDALGVRFHDRELLKRALTHRSYVNELGRDPRDSNERLEFLGDALLGFLVADWLYARFGDLHEGELTARRVALIRTDTLARWSRQLGLGPLLYLSKGETEPEVLSDRILANAFESALAAIHLDAGTAAARTFLAGRLVEADTIIAHQATENHKGRLQELTQDADLRRQYLDIDALPGSGGSRFTPTYVVVARGAPQTDAAFTVEVRVDGRALGVGQGSNKRLAEQSAARDALINLGYDQVEAHNTPSPPSESATIAQ